MKEGIHPKYEWTVMKCACGATYTVGSTVKGVHVGICAACHPFFTGKQKLVDAAGRVEKFKKRYSETPAAPAKKAKVVKPKAPLRLPTKLVKPEKAVMKAPPKPAAPPQA